MRVFIPAATYLFRPHNTDWRYAAKMLPLLGRHCDELSVISQNSRWADWTTNASYAAHVLDRYLKCVPLKWQYSLAQDCPVAERELAQSRADVILSYERYPACDRGLPVVWMTGPTLAENLTGKYARSEWITRELEWKTARAERATRILFTSTDAMEKFLSTCGERFRTKSAMVPFFLPGLSAIEDSDSKWNVNELRMLFVGREARRKGLPQLLEVLRESHLPRNMRLTIVSTFADGVVDIPSLPGVEIAVHGSPHMRRFFG